MVSRRKKFFFEKRTKKLLDSGARVATGADRRGKSFLLLFFKKEVLSFYLPGGIIAAVTP
jgi:hypothetical protein